MGTPITKSEVSEKRGGFPSALFITPPKLSDGGEDGQISASKTSDKGPSSVAAFDLNNLAPSIDIKYNEKSRFLKFT